MEILSNIKKHLINLKNEFMGLSKISKIVVGLILIVILIFLNRPSTKYYVMNDDIEIKDDLFLYRNKIIDNGVIFSTTGSWGGIQKIKKRIFNLSERRVYGR